MQRILLGHNSSRKERLQHRSVAPLLLYGKRTLQHDQDGAYLSFTATCKVVVDGGSAMSLTNSDIGYLRHDGETWRLLVQSLSAGMQESFQTFALMVQQNMGYVYPTDESSHPEIYWGLVMVHTSAQYRGCGETEVEQQHLAPWVSSGQWLSAHTFELRVPVEHYERLVANEYRVALGELMGEADSDLENRSLSCDVANIASASSGNNVQPQSVLTCPISPETSYFANPTSSTSAGLLLQLLRAVTLRGKDAAIAVQMTIFQRANAEMVPEFAEVMNAYRQDLPMSICVKKDRRGRVQSFLRLSSGADAKFILLGVLLTSYTIRLRLRVDGSGGGVFATDFMLSSVHSTSETIFKVLDLGPDSASIQLLKSSPKRSLQKTPTSSPSSAAKTSASSTPGATKSLDHKQKSVAFDPALTKLIDMAQMPSQPSQYDTVPTTGNKIRARPHREQIAPHMSVADAKLNAAKQGLPSSRLELTATPLDGEISGGISRVNSTASMEDRMMEQGEFLHHQQQMVPEASVPFGGYNDITVRRVEFGANADDFIDSLFSTRQNFLPDFGHAESSHEAVSAQPMDIHGTSPGLDSLLLDNAEHFLAAEGQRPLFPSSSTEDLMDYYS